MIANIEALPLPCQKSLRIENYDHILSPFTSPRTHRPRGRPAKRAISSWETDLSIGPSRIPADLDFHKAGEAIANDSSIKHIHLYDMGSKAGNGQRKTLFDGIARSKSIKKIEIDSSTLDQELSQVFHAPNIEVLQLYYCKITAETSASLRHCTGLRKVELFNCRFSCNGKSVGEFFDSMKNGPLQSLMLRNTCVSSNALVSVNELLREKRSTLQELDFCRCCYGKEIEVLASDLAVCKLMKSLKLSNLEKYGWRSLFTLLAMPGISLCKLDLSTCFMSAGMAIKLATYTSNLSSLKELSLQNSLNKVSEDVLVEMFPKLLGSNSALEILELSWNNMQDGAAVALANALAENRTLTTLGLSACRITTEGWLAFSQALSTLNIDSALKKLDLSSNDFDDRGVIALANAMARNESLESLNLSDCRAVTPMGWVTFSSFLRTNSVVKRLHINRNHVAADQVIVAFADALRRNPASSLEELDIYLPIFQEDDEDIQIYYSGEDVVFTSDGWGAISNLLCNTSSIEATKFSNHTLCDLGIHVDDEDTKALLELNKSHNKSKVAHNKIIKCHFSGASDVVALAGNENKLLPDTLSFFGKDELGLSALYTMLKSKSEVMNRNNSTTSSSH